MAVQILRRGLMLVLSSPSGAGKTTISRQLLKKDQDITMSISVTTRVLRSSEIHGEDYHFLSEEEFIMMRDRGDFLEYAKVFNHYYGTPRMPVEKVLTSGQDVLFDIDWQGTQQLSVSTGEDIVRIFILPPSLEDLKDRLCKRAQDSSEVVTKRMEEAVNEMSHYDAYDYVIVNENIEKSVHQVQIILQSERLKRVRQIGIDDFVQKMRQSF